MQGPAQSGAERPDLNPRDQTLLRIRKSPRRALSASLPIKRRKREAHNLANERAARPRSLTAHASAEERRCGTMPMEVATPRASKQSRKPQRSSAANRTDAIRPEDLLGQAGQIDRFL